MCTNTSTTTKRKREECTNRKKGLLEEYVPCIPLPGRWCQPPQLWHDQSMLLHSSKTLLMITEFVTNAKKKLFFFFFTTNIGYGEARKCVCSNLPKQASVGKVCIYVCSKHESLTKFSFAKHPKEKKEKQGFPNQTNKGLIIAECCRCPL